MSRLEKTRKANKSVFYLPTHLLSENTFIYPMQREKPSKVGRSDYVHDYWFNARQSCLPKIEPRSKKRCRDG